MFPQQSSLRVTLTPSKRRAFFLSKTEGGILLEVKINREIRNYTESMFFGLSLRQFVFSLLAVGVAVLLYTDAVGLEFCSANTKDRRK